MTTAAEVIATVRSGPSGPKIGAFFDLDGTIVQGYTAGTFYAQRIRRGEVSPVEFTRTLIAALDGTLFGGDITRFGELGLAGFAGRGEDEIAELGERLFVQKIAGTIRSEARDIVRAHVAAGHTVVVASSATRAQIEPVARDLGIDHLLCTELDVEDGILTGKSSTGMLWGEAKAKAVRTFARQHGIHLPASHAYANGQEDIAFLASVGRPHALNPHPVLKNAAKDYGWPVVTLREPSTPGPRSLLGTAGLIAGMEFGLSLAATLGVLTRDRQGGLNTGVPIACDLGLGLAGVRLNVIGKENLEKARPAVFIANHQSSLDLPILGALLRHDFTGVAKKEVKRDPRMMLITALLNPAYIDRSNSTKAIAELDKTVKRIRGGTSVVIMPEGTRMPTPVLGPFKKGAFHMAIQAGVPVVPIVIRNAGELMWRASKMVNPGTIDVCVLDPVPTDGWTSETLAGHIATIRQLYVDTLEDWPGDEPA
ncbi:HAD-IB family hydrolase [Leekyejoonella antrihumi]|uniref:1-acyl-sn-glycerol-3-phosphate acyltransferase n=1 Tax=Leekyejoonella antrihumi TaxID=1660198 RepID=A0A563DYD3_9MICO|nr:HAD-IB family hydrolase [Leekyejoonella antrihumi]TWP35270.1 HAD-IB family hydrolase [Leekyejoonella antrihumi]